MSAIDNAVNEARRERDQLERALADAVDYLHELERLAAKRRARTNLTTEEPDELIPPPQRTDPSPAVSRPAGAPEPNGLRGLILAIFSERPGDVLSVEDVYSALTERGWTSSSKEPRGFVSNRLSQLVGDGRLARAGRNAYSLPADNARVDNEGDDAVLPEAEEEQTIVDDERESA